MIKKTLLVAGLLIALPLRAQEQPSPSAFFEKDYATTHSRSNALIEGQAVAGADKVKENTRRKSQDQKREQEADDFAHQAKSDDSASMQQEGLRIRNMSAILSPDDARHLSQALEQIQRLQQKHQIPIKDLMLVGDSKKILSSPEFQQLADLEEQANLRYLFELPKAYKAVKRSPTFILETQDGEILLEGFSKLNKLFNARGEFIEPRAD